MQFVYDFVEARGLGREVLGGKGAGLAEMTGLGLNVPPGFTIITEACRAYLSSGEAVLDSLWVEIEAALERLEERAGRRFLTANSDTPLLLSVRSGAEFSMPGMMDTVLNLGINDDCVDLLAEWGNGHFAWDAYRRFTQTFGGVVNGVPSEEFEAVLTALREERGASDDAGLESGDLERATRSFQEIVTRSSGQPPPADPIDQLRSSVRAVFESWNNPRAQTYRRIHGISDDLGTACNVQMMVFGDLDDESGTGVCFTRDPATGENVSYGDYLVGAQGEDIVAGARNTKSLAEFAEANRATYDELLGVMKTLEAHYRDMCDIEFTIEHDRLWILQTRIGNRTARAAIRMATEMVAEKLITHHEALSRVTPSSLEQLLHPRLADDLDVEPLATGVAASPGAARGRVVFDANTAERWVARGENVILVRSETTPDDIHGLAVADGVLTSRGGKTSHAAVVARGMGKPAITGADVLEIRDRGFSVAGTLIEEGDEITLDGGRGLVYAGSLDLVPAEPTPEMELLLSWADEVRTMGVRANADTPEDAAKARERGAEGIGLARTEHMFMGERLPIIQRIILTADPTELKTNLEHLRKLQVADFEGILEAMDGLPVIVRLLDPPLHEFLPDRWNLEKERLAAVEAGEPTGEIDELMIAVSRWEEVNPMLGLRGVRLGLVMPELYRMQIESALAAVAERLEAGGDPHLEIMIPLVSVTEELRRSREMIEEEIRVRSSALGKDLPVRIGTMIETPRAALTAGEVTEFADFISFGTNDLTQMTYGFSRDDAEGKFLAAYLDDGILISNPFEQIDPDGVGQLVAIATKAAKEADGMVEVGVCGEHGGDPSSIMFFQSVGLDYVSCSPPRLPVARLAAAQAELGLLVEGLESI